MKNFVFVVLFIVSSSVSVFANESNIEEGFKAFQEGGVEAAWNAWAKGGPLEGSKLPSPNITKNKEVS